LRAVIEKELKSYFFTAKGYIFIGVFLLLSGYFFLTYNILGENSDVGVMLENMVVSFILLIPVLTMGLFAGEKKSGTAKLFYLAPISKIEIVLGKYISATIVFVIAVLINSISSVVMIFFKGQTLGEVFAVYTGFILLGMSFIAVGIFVSAVCDNRIIAAIISFCTCFLLYLSGWLLDVSSMFLIRLFAVTEHFSNFTIGIYDLKSALYYLSLIAVFIIFTVVFIERVEIKTERKFGISFIFACTIVSFVLFNYCVEKLSNKVQMTFDMSQNGVFELSDETENYLDSLNENINIYYLTESGRESPYIAEVLGRYKRASNYINIKNVDIIKNPSFTIKYVQEGETLDKGAIIVESERRFTIIDPGSVFVINRDKNGNISRELGFTLETKLTCALDYVLLEEDKSVLCLTGHGESSFALPASVLKSENIRVEYAESFDENSHGADVIVMFAPKNDINDFEYEEISLYLEQGGKLFLILEPGFINDNIGKLTKQYGMMANNDLLTVENMSQIIRNNKLYLITYPVKNELNGSIGGTRNLVFPVSGSINIDNSDTCEITKLAVTDAKTASRVIEADSIGEKTSEGMFTVAAVSENKENGSAVFLAATPQFLVPEDSDLGNLLSAYNFSNREFFIKSIKNLLDYEENVVVAPKNIMSRSLNMGLGTQLFLVVTLGLLIPISFFVCGFVVYKRRRNR